MTGIWQKLFRPKTYPQAQEENSWFWIFTSSNFAALNWKLTFKKFRNASAQRLMHNASIHKDRKETTVSAALEACFCRMIQLDMISDVTKLETNLIEDYFWTNSESLSPMFNAQCVNSQKAERRLCRRRMKLVFAVALECCSFVREGKNWRQSCFLVLDS